MCIGNIFDINPSKWYVGKCLSSCINKEILFLMNNKVLIGGRKKKKKKKEFLNTLGVLGVY